MEQMKMKKAKRKLATKRVTRREKKRVVTKKASNATAESEAIGGADLRQEVGVYTLSPEEEALLAERSRPKR
jgi:hypothetical protein